MEFDLLSHIVKFHGVAHRSGADVGSLHAPAVRAHVIRVVPSGNLPAIIDQGYGGKGADADLRCVQFH
jgi:hypothetical protein